MQEMRQKMNVEIRQYKDTDAIPIYEAAIESCAEVSPWMAWCHDRYSYEDAVAWIEFTAAEREAGRMYDFAIYANDVYAGSCGINQINTTDKVANLGYWLRTSMTGQGIAPDAVRKLLDWGFSNTDLVRFEIVAAVDNYRSQRVAVKAGATRDAVLRKRTMVNGRSSDAILYSIIRDD